MLQLIYTLSHLHTADMDF